MSLLGYDGADHYAGQNDLQSRFGSLQWYLLKPGTPDSFYPRTTGGRNGSGCVEISSPPEVGGYPSRGYVYYNNTDPLTTVGMAVNFYGSANPIPFSISLVDAGSSNQEQVRFEVSQSPSQVKAYKGSTLLGASPINVFSVSGYNYFEFQSVTDPTAGTVHVRVNGQSVLNVTGINTQQSTHSYATGVLITGNYESVGFLDDLYIANGVNAGGTYPCNSFLGDVHVQTLFATSNNSVTWTPLAGTNWQEISETVFDGDASYNSTATIGDTDSFNMAALPSTTIAVICVQLTGAYRKEGAGSHSITQKITSGGVTAVGSTWVLTETYQYFSDMFMSDPDTTVAWTVSAVNGMNPKYTLSS